LKLPLIISNNFQQPLAGFFVLFDQETATIPKKISLVPFIGGN
jgi:hypothetical protein